MSRAETFRPEIDEAYKNSIMRRCGIALENPRGNCHSAAYYLLGITPHEIRMGGGCYVDTTIFTPVDNIDRAVLVSFAKDHGTSMQDVHLATLHPFDKSEVIHRDVSGYYETRRARHNIFTGIADFCKQITVGGNPIMVEKIDEVRQRWAGSDYFQMYLFKFRPEYFKKLLASL